MVLEGTLPALDDHKMTKRIIRGFVVPPLADPLTADTFLSSNEGVITSRHPNQMYYWSEEWQNREQAARAHILAGRVTSLAGPSEVERHFNALIERSQARRRRRGSKGR